MRAGLLRRANTSSEPLVGLMGARLALAFVSLGIALALELAGEEIPHRLYATVSAALAASVLTGLMLPRIRRAVRFAALNIAVDIAVVTGLVHFSGGPDSVFVFLYEVVALYGALLLNRRGGLITASLGSLAYGGVLLASSAPLLTQLGLWSVHAVAMATVAALGSFLGGELRQRTRDLRRLEGLHERTVESLKSGLLTLDADDRITSFNPEAERITGWRAGDAAGRLLDAVLPGAGEVLRELDSTPQRRRRLPYRNRREENLHLGVGAYVLRDTEGDSGGWVVIFQDLTEVVALEQDLRRSERMAAIGELSASIAHEIRNPLAAISGSIQMLKRGADAPATGDSGSRLMGIVLRETDRLNALITDFLHYARPEPLELEPLELRSLVDELLELLESVVPDGVRIEVGVAEGVRVVGDASRLRQVLWNLTLNAVQAMPEGGVVWIEARRHGSGDPQGAATERRHDDEKGGWVDVCVRDEGSGIAPDLLNQVFDPFFTTKPSGTGLGLPTVHRIVEEHRGSIRVESRVGEGTSIRIRLPGAQGAAE